MVLGVGAVFNDMVLSQARNGMSIHKDALVKKLESKEAVIGIVGLGYVGLPLMLRYSGIGFRVIGIDIDNAKVDALNKGESYIAHIAASRIANAIASGFEATVDFARATE